MTDLGTRVSRRTALAAGVSVATYAMPTEARRKRHKRHKRRKHDRAVLTRTSTASQPDVLVFLTDDMRTDDWPILQQAQARIGGAWFPNFCFDVAVCAASRATLLTGQGARTHGVTSNGDADQRFQSREADSLAPAVQAAGYHTSYVGKYINEYNGKRLPPGWSDWRAITMDGDTYKVGGKYATSAESSRAREAILSAPSDKPLFLLVSHHAPHEPHTPARRYEKKKLGGTRNQDDRERKRCLLSVDDAIAAAADTMGERWHSAVILFMSDNGFLLGEHGTDGKAIWWDQAARCPLLARLPGIPDGADNRMVSNTDVCPTLLRATGATAWWPMQGKPLQDAWTRDGVLIQGFQGQSSGEPRTPFAGIKGPGWVYVEAQGKAPQYYADPGESTNAIATIDQPAYAAWLQELLAE
ncbi:MAG: sulfatase-like hydrolase/transferase [Chloroflexota bacterium]|nr:sulfatase-like hydrolase/transferase [Chloroflexota bacterium]